MCNVVVTVQPIREANKVVIHNKKDNLAGYTNIFPARTTRRTSRFHRPTVSELTDVGACRSIERGS
jgi:hypothetical protein